MADKKQNNTDISWKEEQPLMSSSGKKIGPHERQMGYKAMDDILQHRSETFSQKIVRLFEEKKTGKPYLKDYHIYKKADITSSHFCKIKYHKDYQPNKGTVISLACALRLSIKETEDLLLSAGYGLSDSKKEDLIVRYFIEHQRYSLTEINLALDFFDLQPLEKM